MPTCDMGQGESNSHHCPSAMPASSQTGTTQMCMYVIKNILIILKDAIHVEEWIAQINSQQPLSTIFVLNLLFSLKGKRCYVLVT